MCETKGGANKEPFQVGKVAKPLDSCEKRLRGERGRKMVDALREPSMDERWKTKLIVSEMDA